MEPDTQALRQWYEEYLAIDKLKYDNTLAKTVVLDTLDLDSIERQIKAITSKRIVTGRFCYSCQNIFDNWPLKDSTQSEWEEVHLKSTDTIDVEASSRKGCKFCEFILQIWRDRGILEILRKIETRINRLGEKSLISLSAIIANRRLSSVRFSNPNRPYDANDDPTREFFCVATQAPDNQYDIPMGRFEIIKSWLKTCTKTHTSCNTATSARQLPTRLISIAGEKPRLLITADLDADLVPLHYATLSYCWGQGDFLKLKLENLELFKKGIPADRIPKTFQDSFEIMKALKIELIWIDALCIIQDDPLDWERESLLMQLVYGGSYINIAASSAKNVNGGCFLDQPYHSNGVYANVMAHGTQRTKLFHDWNLETRPYELSVLNSHLMTRGWALQEKILPARTLHFGDRGASWECKNNFITESLPGKPASLTGRNGFLVCGYKKNINDSWGGIVSRFSKSNLTIRSDKLPALSGIAAALQNETGSKYLAGMWQRNFEVQLYWCIDQERPEERQERRNSNWIAPSWSWLSMDVRVHSYSNVTGDLTQCEPYTHFLKADMTFAGPEPFGKISSGVLYMGCSCIVPGRLHEPGFANSKNIPWEHESVSLAFGEKEQIIRVEIDCSEDGCSGGDDLVYLFPLFKDTIHSRPKIFGLVIRKTSGSAGEFCRLGSFVIWEYYSCYKPFLQILDEVGASTAREICAEEITDRDYPTQKYVITLI